MLDSTVVTFSHSIDLASPRQQLGTPNCRHVLIVVPLAYVLGTQLLHALLGIVSSSNHHTFGSSLFGILLACTYGHGATAPSLSMLASPSFCVHRFWGPLSGLPLHA